MTLPDCLSDTALGGPLPSGRAALAGTVRDPYAHTNERVSRERRVEACAAGEHGQGRTRVREVTQTNDERGNPVGDPVHGPWQLLIDECRADLHGLGELHARLPLGRRAAAQTGAWKAARYGAA